MSGYRLGRYDGADFNAITHPVAIGIGKIRVSRNRRVDLGASDKTIAIAVGVERVCVGASFPVIVQAVAIRVRQARVRRREFCALLKPSPSGIRPRQRHRTGLQRVFSTPPIRNGGRIKVERAVDDLHAQMPTDHPSTLVTFKVAVLLVRFG